MRRRRDRQSRRRGDTGSSHSNRPLERVVFAQPMATFEISATSLRQRKILAPHQCWLQSFASKVPVDNSSASNSRICRSATSVRYSGELRETGLSAVPAWVGGGDVVKASSSSPGRTASSGGVPGILTTRSVRSLRSSDADASGPRARLSDCDFTSDRPCSSQSLARTTLPSLTPPFPSCATSSCGLGQ